MKHDKLSLMKRTFFLINAFPSKNALEANTAVQTTAETSYKCWVGKYKNLYFIRAFQLNYLAKMCKKINTKIKLLNQLSLARYYFDLKQLLSGKRKKHLRKRVLYNFRFSGSEKMHFLTILFTGELLQPVRGRDQQRRGGGGGGRSEAGGVERSLHQAGVTESQIMGNTEYIFLLEMKQG
jgi:hypothetical protein